MSMIDQFQKLDDLILEQTQPPIQTKLRAQLALMVEEIEAYQAASDKQAQTLATQIKTIERLMKENQDLVSENPQSEKIRIHSSGIEFRIGKRNGMKWAPFCPNCHTPIQRPQLPGISKEICVCPSGCGWHSTMALRDVWEIEAWPLADQVAEVGSLGQKTDGYH